MTTTDEPAAERALPSPDRRPLNTAERLWLYGIFVGIAILIAGLAFPTLRVAVSDGRWLAVTPCTLVTGLGTHMTGGDPQICKTLFSGVPVLGWMGNLHNRNLVAWGFWIFMIGLLGSGGLTTEPTNAE